MDAMQTVEVARALLSAHGGRAEAEAERKTREAKAAGNAGDAEQWDAIRLAIRARSGLHLNHA